MWLSVLVPVYNVRSYVADCVRSVVEQQADNVEIVLLDDCSTDGSLQVCEQLTAQYPQVRLVRHECNRGLSAARNTLLEHARGDYIWFLDSDDFIVPGALKRLRTACYKDNPDMVLFDYWMVPEDADYSQHHPVNAKRVTTFPDEFPATGNCPEHLLQGILKKRRFQPWARISRRSLWQHNVSFPEGRYFEDVYCTPKLVNRVGHYRYLAQPLIGYRNRPESIVRNPDLQKVRDFLAGPHHMQDNWNAEAGEWNRATRFAHLSFSAHTFVNAMKLLKKGGLNSRETRGRLRREWYDAHGLHLYGLVSLFIRNGDFGGLYRLLRYFYGSKAIRGSERDARHAE